MTVPYSKEERKPVNSMDTWFDCMKDKPPIRRFVSGQGWQPKKLPYVLAVDVKGRMSVGYASEHSGYDKGYDWTFAKPIGEPTHWTPLPDPPTDLSVL